jgi:hypothetical protein
MDPKEEKIKQDAQETIEELTGVDTTDEEVVDNDGEESDVPEVVEVRVKIEEEKPKAKRNSKLGLSKEMLSKIPRPGECIHIVDRYPVNDDEDPSKKGTICAYSLTPITVMSSSLSEDLKKVYVNADIELSLQRKPSFMEDSKEIFADEDEAYERWKELMEASLEVAEEYVNDFTEKRNFVKEALKEGNR